MARVKEGEKRAERVCREAKRAKEGTDSGRRAKKSAQSGKEGGQTGKEGARLQAANRSDRLARSNLRLHPEPSFSVRSPL